jgi:signal transduction histidine kinase
MNDRSDRFQHMIARLATTLAAGIGVRFDEAVNQALEQTGVFVGADRTYLIVFDDSSRTATNTHEWCADGIEPQLERLSAISLDAMPWFVEQIRAGPVRIDDVDQLPEEAPVEREFMAMQSICSLLLVPVRSSAGVVGFVGFDAVHRHRSWVDPEVELLAVLATIIGSMVERESAYKALDLQERRLRAIVEAIPDLVFSVHTDGRLLFIKDDPALVVPVDEALGKTVEELLEPGVAKGLVGAVRESAGGRIVVEHHYNLALADGRHHRFEARMAPHASDEVTVIVRDVTERLSNEEALEDHRERLRLLATELADAEQRLRHDITAEVHDGIAQEIAMARLLVARALHEPEEARSMIELVDGVLEGVDQHISQLLRNIDPPTLRSLGLVPALREVCELLHNRHGLTCTVRQSVDPSELGTMDRTEQAMIYWSARELMLNVVKHANASQMDLEVSAGGGRLRLVVSDDGEGFAEEPKPGFGLFRVRERLRLANGELRFSRSPLGGASAIIEMDGKDNARASR